MSKVNMPKLRTLCLADREYFYPFGDVVQTEYGPYIFVDNNASILGVAHLDYAIPQLYYYESGGLVYSPQLDDRLGVYILFVLSNSIKFDMLLTWGEESGKSTAQFFAPRKDYNWVFEFDRCGVDCVMYEFETEEMSNAVKQAGIPVGQGTFSDICWLHHLESAAFNFGCGYYRAHSYACHANPSHTNSMIEKFKAFYHANKDRKFEYSDNYSYYVDFGYNDCEMCAFCREMWPVYDMYPLGSEYICDFCRNDLLSTLLVSQSEGQILISDQY